MAKKIKWLLILFGLILLFVVMAHTAAADTYEVTFDDPTIDGDITYSGGAYSSHDYTGSTAELRKSSVGSVWDIRSFFEWNISSIPVNANILKVSFEWISNGAPITGSSAVYAMETMPSAQSNDAAGAQVIWNAIDAGLSLTPGGSGMPGGASGTHYYLNETPAAATYVWGQSPKDSLEENLSRGWFALGIKRIITAGSDSQAYIRTENYNGVEIKPQLWVQYEMTAPEISNPSPADGATGVNLTPDVCIDLNHSYGSGMNLTWYWYNDSSGNWEYMGQNGSTPTYWKECKIDHDWVDETLVNYPLWFYNTSNDFKSVANGGRLREDGADIQFWNFSNSSQMAHELEYYDPVTGTIGAWVNVSYLYSDKDTVFYIRYGDGSTDNDNPTAVWDGYFVAVYHCNNSYQFFDSTAYGNDGVRSGSPSNVTDGVYGKAINFTSATSDYYSVIDDPSLRFGTGYFTVERWFTTPTLSAANYRYMDYQYTSPPGTGLISYLAKSTNAYDLRTIILDQEGDQITIESGNALGIDDCSWHNHVYNVNGNTGTQWIDVNFDISTGTNVNYDSGCTNNQPWYFGASDAPASFMNYQMDEIRITKGLCRNDSYMNFTYNWTANGLYWAFLGDENVSGANVTNGTYCMEFVNATEPCTTYYWWVHAVDENGNYTDEIFEFTTHCINPPTGGDCTRYNSTTLNITWIEKPDNGGTTWTEVWYQEGYTAPGYGEGTYGGNTTNQSMNFTGLQEGTCYTFSLWTHWNSSDGDWYTSSIKSTILCCTKGGDYRFCLRYEEYNQQYINLSHYPCSNHILAIHFINGSRQIEFLNATIYEANGNSSCFDYHLDEEPLFFELWWNASFGCGTYNSTSYVRRLTPNAATNESGNLTITFYLVTDRRVYLDEYEYFGNESIEYDMEDNLIPYIFSFDDRTHSFDIRESFNTYITFYFFNTTNKIIVHQEYWDSAQKVYPVLLYEKAYFTGVADNDTLIGYENIGLAPNHALTEETIIIYLRDIETITIDDAIDIHYGWSSGAAGLWVLYEDSESNTIWVNVTVYNASDGSYEWSENVSDADAYNFTWPAAYHDSSYEIVITIMHGDFGYVQVKVPIAPGMSTLTTAAFIDAMFYDIFGVAPFYNTETGVAISWTHMIILFIAILLGMIIVYNPTIGIMAPGIWLIVAYILISGLPFAWLAVGFLLITMGIVYALAGGGPT